MDEDQHGLQSALLTSASDNLRERGTGLGAPILLHDAEDSVFQSGVDDHIMLFVGLRARREGWTYSCRCAASRRWAYCYTYSVTEWCRRSQHALFARCAPQCSGSALTLGSTRRYHMPPRSLPRGAVSITATAFATRNALEQLAVVQCSNPMIIV